MAKGWACPRCSTANDETAINCSNCGLIHGGVVVPSSFTPSPVPQPSPALPDPVDTAPAGADPVGAYPAGAYPVGAGPVADAPPEEPGGVGWAAISTSGTSTPGASTPLAPTSGVEWTPGPPPPPKPLWRRIPIGLVIFAVLIFGGGIVGFFVNASRSGTGEITKGGDLTSFELRVGDCWNPKDPAADVVSDVAAVPCSQEHQYEVFFVGSMPGSAYPAEDAFNAFVEDACTPAFEAYVGTAYLDSILDVNTLYPTSDSWDAGGRTVRCSLYDPSVSRLTASKKGSNE